MINNDFHLRERLIPARKLLVLRRVKVKNSDCYSKKSVKTSKNKTKIKQKTGNSNTKPVFD